MAFLLAITSLEQNRKGDVMTWKAWLILVTIGLVLSGLVTSFMFYFGWLNESQAIKLAIMGTIAIPVSERLFPIVLKK